tara:strand:+ start:2451 stop:2861 length:411 start_codon:yes stop_codon:yes gene_type:complete
VIQINANVVLVVLVSAAAKGLTRFRQSKENNMKLIMENWRKLVKEFNVGQFLGGELAASSAEDEVRNLVRILGKHSDKMAKRVRFLDSILSKTLSVPEEPAITAEKGQIEKLLSDREAHFRKVIDKLAELQNKKQL